MPTFRIHVTITTATYLHRDIVAETLEDAIALVEDSEWSTDEGWIDSPKSSADSYIDYTEEVA